MTQPEAPHDLHGRVVVITRPVGAAAAMMRRVRAAGGQPLHVPGMALRTIDDAATRAALAAALRAERVIFTSPAAVRFANALQPLPAGQPGLLQVISVLPQSYPGHSLLTEDLGAWDGVDDADAGMAGRFFHVTGRAPRSEIRGCSDTYVQPA